MTKGWVKERLRFQHCEKECQEAISETAQGAPVTVAATDEMLQKIREERDLVNLSKGE